MSMTIGVSVCTLHGILWLHVFGHLLIFFLHNDIMMRL